MTIEQQTWSKPAAHTQSYQVCGCQKYSEKPVEHCSHPLQEFIHTHIIQAFSRNLAL